VAISGWPAGSLAAVYDPTEEGGLGELSSADAVLAFVRIHSLWSTRLNCI